MSPSTAAGRRSVSSPHRRGVRGRARALNRSDLPTSSLKGIACRLRISLPEGTWPHELTMAHPGEEIRVLNRTLIPGGLRRYEFVVAVENPGQWIAELRQMEGTVDVSGVILADGSALINLVLRRLALDPLFQRRGLLWKFPFPVREGTATAEVIGTYPDVLRTIEDLGTHGFAIHLEAVGNQAIHDLGTEPNGSEEGFSEHLWVPLEGLYTRVLSFSDAGVASPDGTPGPSAIEEIRPGGPPAGAPWGIGHLAVCRLGLSLPSQLWASRLSQKYPESAMEIVGELVVDSERTMVDFRVRSAASRNWAEEIRALPGVLHVDQLGKSGPSSMVRVTFQSHPLYARFGELNLMWRMPSPLKEGVLTMVIVGQDESIRRMIDDWRSAGLSVALESVRHQEEEPRTLLTPRQEEIFRRAMSAGYYDVPRKATLSELASSMGMAVSSLSEILAVVEKKLLHHAETSK